MNLEEFTNTFSVCNNFQLKLKDADNFVLFFCWHVLPLTTHRRLNKESANSERICSPYRAEHKESGVEEDEWMNWTTADVAKMESFGFSLWVSIPIATESQGLTTAQHHRNASAVQYICFNLFYVTQRSGPCDLQTFKARKADWLLVCIQVWCWLLYMQGWLMHPVKSTKRTKKVIGGKWSSQLANYRGNYFSVYFQK